jgi:hypothetical protein
MLPSENKIIIRENAALFYISRTINERQDGVVLAEQFMSLCVQAMAVAKVIGEAGAAGVEKAATLSALIQATDTFADEAKATAFLATFQAALDA